MCETKVHDESVVVTEESQYDKASKKFGIKRLEILDEETAIFVYRKFKTNMNRPIQIAHAILCLSKIMLFEEYLKI